MKIDVKNINDYTKEVKLDIPWSTLEPDFNTTLKNFSKKVKLPGFRPGKIPRDRLMQQFQPNIEAQFMDDNIYKLKLLFVSRACSSAVEHYGDIVGVAGSNPAAPTTLKKNI